MTRYHASESGSERPNSKKAHTRKAHTRQAQKSYCFTCVYNKLSYNWQNADAILFILSDSIPFLQTYCKGFPYFKYISCQSKSVGTNAHVWERQIANELEKWIYLNIYRINKNKQAMTVKQIIQKYKLYIWKKLKDLNITYTFWNSYKHIMMKHKTKTDFSDIMNNNIRVIHIILYF